MKIWNKFPDHHPLSQAPLSLYVVSKPYSKEKRQKGSDGRWVMPSVDKEGLTGPSGKENLEDKCLPSKIFDEQIVFRCKRSLSRNFLDTEIFGSLPRSLEHGVTFVVRLRP